MFYFGLCPFAHTFFIRIYSVRISRLQMRQNYRIRFFSMNYYSTHFEQKNQCF